MSYSDEPITIAQLLAESYRVSRQHGFWDDAETPETIPSKLALIHSEISEALESYRDPESDTLVKVPVHIAEALLANGDVESDDPEDRRAGFAHLDALAALRRLYEKWQAKPRGFDIELADAAIRIGDLAGRKGIDLEAAIRRKAAYNETRPRKHGRLV